jgi:hypothetical protein
MNSSFSRTQFPPNGWIFHQPQTNWTAPSPKSSTFDQTVQQIIKMRRDNGGLTVRHRLALDPVSVGNELETFTRARLGIPNPTAAQPYNITMAPLVVTATDDVLKLAGAVAMLMDWNDNGLPPVAQDQAKVRAAVCAKCPLNSMAKLNEWLSVPVAGALKQKLARLYSLPLKTPGEGQLGLCLASFVPLTLKVHAPIGVIQKRVESRKLTGLAEGCWVMSEIAAK